MTFSSHENTVTQTLKNAAEAVASANAAAAEAKLAISATAEAVRLAIIDTAAKAIQAAEAVKLAITETAAKAAVADKAVNQVANTATATAVKATQAVRAVKMAISDTAETSAAAVKVANIAVESATAVKDAVNAAENAETEKVAMIAAETVKAFRIAAETAIAVKLAIEAVANSGAEAVKAASVAAEATHSVASSAALAVEIASSAATATEAVATFAAGAVKVAKVAAEATEAVANSESDAIKAVTNLVQSPEAAASSGAEAIKISKSAAEASAAVAISGAEAVKVANIATETTEVAASAVAEAIEVAKMVAKTAEAVAVSSAKAVKVASAAADTAEAAATAAATATTSVQVAMTAAKTADAVKAAYTATVSAEAVKAAAEAVAASADEALKIATEAVITVAAAAEAAATSLTIASSATDALKLAIVTIAENSSEAVKVAAETTAAAAAMATIDKEAAAEMASRLKSQFIAHMSHEIRTPLAIIRGYSEVLEKDEDSSQKKIWLSKIINSTRELELLINDILDISKVESGKIEVEIGPVDLPHIIAELKEMLSLNVAEKGIHLDFSFEGSVPSMINTDPLRLKQILLNVIGNAVKFTDKGEVSVTVKLIPPHGESENTLLAFVISDTGIGMTAEQSERIFESFIQADSSITRRFGGTGLGLSLSLGLAQLLGGNIVIAKTEVETGSTFIVTIDPSPIAGVAMLEGQDSLEMESTKVNEEVVEGDSLKGLKILLVEDAEDIRALIYHLFVCRGSFVTEAVNGEEGVRLARESNFDLILMDLQMPVMDGYRATQSLRMEGCHVPIVALTAHAMIGERERCKSAGFTDFLSKPIDIKKLFELASKYRRAENFASHSDES